MSGAPPASSASQARPALDHIEKTLADGYRKEIDQEENVWRSLPFFAAGMALQLAAAVAVLGRVQDLPEAGRGVAFVALMVAAGLSLGVLGFMAAAIYPVRFVYISSERALLGYVLNLEQAQRDHPEQGEALPILKQELALQYAQATTHNRKLNQRRALFRSIAGLLMLGSVVAIVVVVFATTVHHIRKQSGMPPGTEGDRRYERSGTDQPAPGAAAPQ